MTNFLSLRKCYCDDACGSGPNSEIYVFTDKEAFFNEIYVDWESGPCYTFDHIEISDNKLYSYAFEKCLKFFDKEDIEWSDKYDYDDDVILGGRYFFYTEKDFENYKAKGINIERYGNYTYEKLFDSRTYDDLAEEIALASIDLSDEKNKDIRPCLLYLMYVANRNYYLAGYEKNLEETILEQMKKDSVV